MPASRSRGAFRLSLTIVIIVAGAVLLSTLFYTFWQRLNHQVEVILQDQFNQQQLMLARKIADNVESYFDFLENALLGYAGLFQTTPPDERDYRCVPGRKVCPAPALRPVADYPLQLRRRGGAVLQHLPHPPPAGSLTLPADFLKWAQDPEHRGRLFLSKTFDYPDAPWKGRRVMRFITPLYWGTRRQNSPGCWNFSSTPSLSAQKLRRTCAPGKPAMPGSLTRT